MNEQGGSFAAINGREIENLIRILLSRCLRMNKDAKTLSQLLNITRWQGNLYEDDGSIGSFCTQCEVPLVSNANHGKNRKAVIDFALVTKSGDPCVLSVKSQKSDGSAEQKLWFEIQQLIDTEMPSAMLVYGPVKHRDSVSGWGHEFLKTIWDWTKWHGKSVLLFRNEDNLMRWIRDGFPTTGKGRTFQQTFRDYCDQEP